MVNAVGDRLSVILGDITTRRVNAIVNAANSSLGGGGGVDGAIHAAGGPTIGRECRALRESTLPDGLPTGEAVATTGGDLPARWVIHTVGPIWRGGAHDEDALLAHAVDACFSVARQLSEQNAEPIRSIAFPAISTGVYGFPRERAYPIIRDRILAQLRSHTLPQSVELVLHARNDLELYHSVCP